MFNLFKCSLLLVFLQGNRPDIQLPILSDHIELTEIGDFGLTRKARPTVPEHLHTGIDIKRPGQNYFDEPILSVANGVVISRRDDGPYAQIIIEHEQNGLLFWSLYEHIAGIQVRLYEEVAAGQPIARFMNRDELNQYGWQFNHFHFELLKKPPIKIQPTEKTPDRHFRSHTLECFGEEHLRQSFYYPLDHL